MAEKAVGRENEPNPKPTKNDSKPKLVGRRDVLRIGATTAAVAAAGVGSATAAGSYTYEGISFDRKVDAVSDLGLDPNEGELVDDKLGSVPDGTLVEFPTGRYKIDSCWIRSSNVGLVAADGADPVFVPSKPITQTEEWMLLLKTGGDYVVSGFEFDFTRDGYCGTLTVIAKRGDFYIGDIHIRGVTEHSAEGMAVAVEDENGQGTIERFYARDGSAYDSPSHGLIVGMTHAGRLDIVDCEVWNWTDNGVYASSPGYIGSFRGTETTDRGDGEVHIRGGIFKNNNISNVRLGTTNSSVKGAVIHNQKNTFGDSWDSRKYDIMPRSGTEPEPVVNSRGIWLANRRGLVVEDCDIIMETGVSSGAIVAKSMVGNATIRNTRIQVNTTEVLHPVVARRPSIDWPDTSFTFENVSITGVGGNKKVAAEVIERPGTEFRDCCISLDGSGQNGIKFSDTSSGVVADTNVGVDGRSTLFQNSSISTSNVSSADSCPVPNLSGTDKTYGATKKLSHTTTVRSTGESFDYRIVTSEGINRGSHLVDENELSTSAEGTVSADDEHWFWFAGEVLEVELSADAKFFVNGEERDPADYAPEEPVVDEPTDPITETPEDPSVERPEVIQLDGSRTLPHTTTVRSTGSAFDYRVVASEGINQGSHIVENEVSTVVEGTVPAGEEDWFWFAGEILEVELSADAKFFVNGEELDPADYAPEEPVTQEPTDPVTETPENPSVEIPEVIQFDGSRTLSHTTTVRSTGESFDYRVVASEGINQGSHIVENEVSTVVEGTVPAGEEDWFWFAGEILEVELSADAKFFVNGEELDPADYAPEEPATQEPSDGDGQTGEQSELEHVLFVDGSVGEGVSRYTFAVTGDVERSAELSTVPDDAPAADTQEDEVLDGEVSGVVAAGVDAYRFSGSLTRLEITGFAVVDFRNRS